MHPEHSMKTQKINMEHGRSAVKYLNMKIILNYFQGLFFFMALHHQSIAQSTDSLKINAIPHSLIWENKPVKYTIKNDVLTIVAGAKTDMFRDPNVTYNTDNAP